MNYELPHRYLTEWNANLPAYRIGTEAEEGIVVVGKRGLGLKYNRLMPPKHSCCEESGKAGTIDSHIALQID
jgi:hypothetical protein